jgi:hypothetical protein
LTTGTSTSTAPPLQNAIQIEQDRQIEPGREWPSYAGDPMDITPSSTGPLDITPTANRRR